MSRTLPCHNNDYIKNDDWLIEVESLYDPTKLKNVMIFVSRTLSHHNDDNDSVGFLKQESLNDLNK